MFRLKISVSGSTSPSSSLLLLPYFPSVHVHSLAHLRGNHKGAESLWHISIVIFFLLFKNTCSSIDTAVMLIRAMFGPTFLLRVASDSTQRLLLEPRGFILQENVSLSLPTVLTCLYFIKVSHLSLNQVPEAQNIAHFYLFNYFIELKHKCNVKK